MRKYWKSVLYNSAVRNLLCAECAICAQPIEADCALGAQPLNRIIMRSRAAKLTWRFGVQLKRGKSIRDGGVTGKTRDGQHSWRRLFPLSLQSFLPGHKFLLNITPPELTNNNRLAVSVDCAIRESCIIFPNPGFSHIDFGSGWTAADLFLKISLNQYLLRILKYAVLYRVIHDPEIKFGKDIILWLSQKSESEELTPQADSGQYYQSCWTAVFESTNWRWYRAMTGFSLQCRAARNRTAHIATLSTR